jgi:hypothetical protein
VACCDAYAGKNGFSNLDYLLEQMIYSEDAFNAGSMGSALDSASFRESSPVRQAPVVL